MCLMLHLSIVNTQSAFQISFLFRRDAALYLLQRAYTQSQQQLVQAPTWANISLCSQRFLTLDFHKSALG